MKRWNDLCSKIGQTSIPYSADLATEDFPPLSSQLVLTPQVDSSNLAALDLGCNGVTSGGGYQDMAYGGTRADGTYPVDIHSAPQQRFQTPGVSIPFRADHEPPPVYTKPPPSLPYNVAEKIDTINVGVQGILNHKKSQMTLMHPRGFAPPGTIESTQSLTSPHHFGTSGELLMTRTPRNLSWQEAYQTIRRANARRPVSAERYNLVSTYRDSVWCEYMAPVAGQRVPLPHVHVRQNGPTTYKQHLYHETNPSNHYLWKKIEGKRGVGDAKYWEFQ